MVKLLSVVCTLLLAAASAPARQGTSPQKLALIVAISEYPPESGYGRINAQRDVALVQWALVTQDFDLQNIRIIEDSAATREGILAGIAWLAQRAGPGDAIVFHYSGHGHRISDDNGDELDGLDELLVPFGAPATIAGGTYRGEHHIRDDELGVLLSGLRAKVGPSGSVTVFLDACYSGSATRGGPGEATVRGVQTPIVVPGAPSRPPGLKEDDASGAFESVSTRGEPAGLGPLVVVSAARHDQVARETYDANRNPVGSLSLAISLALPRLSPGETYRSMFDRIAVVMSGMNLYDQRPQIEGTVNARVFSGQIVEQTPYHKVLAVVGDSLVRIPGGVLLGLLPGTRVELHPAGTADPRTSTALGRGVVRTANDGSAEVVVLPGASSGSLMGSWAFVTEYAFGDARVRIRLDPTLSVEAQTMARRALSSVPAVEIASSKPDLTIRPTRGGGTGRGAVGERVGLVAAVGGAELGEPLDPAAPETTGELSERVVAFARIGTLRRIELSDSRIKVRMELIRTVPRIRIVGGAPTCPEVSPTLLATPSASAEGIVMSPGDEYTLRLINEGRDPAYVSVLDLTPDGRVLQLFPLPGAYGSDNYLLPGANYLIPNVCFWAEPPAGIEVIKLFATRERLDFEPILTSGGGTRGEALSPLGQLFSDAYRGLRSGTAAATGWGSTAAISLTILPKARPR